VIVIDARQVQDIRTNFDRHLAGTDIRVHILIAGTVSRPHIHHVTEWKMEPFGHLTLIFGRLSADTEHFGANRLCEN